MHLQFARFPLFVFLFLCCFQTGYGQKVRGLLQKATTVLDGGVVADIKNVVTEQVLGSDSKQVKNLLSQFEKGQPISTSFDDAIYEAPFLSDFEPNENEYSHLALQPKTENGAGFRLKSGFYTMNAKSFCLKGYTHGPSRGDGHLFAPMKGKRADFVQSIIEHYATRPDVSQQNVQVLLWAIIAGADLKTLGKQYSATLASLFSPEELLRLTAQGYLEGYTQKYMDDVRGWLGGKIPAELKKLLDADDQIRTMVRENRTFQEIERFAVLAGVPQRDMIREVSRGQWSYHPGGFFVRYFPNGYRQTRVDVYVPFDSAVVTDSGSKAVAINQAAKQPKEVVFTPASMVAAPANRPSQRIGISPIPVNPIPIPEETDRRVIPFHLPHVAYLPIEGAGIHGSFVIKGNAILEKKNGRETLSVIVNASSNASNFGQLQFFGDVDLIVNGVSVQSLPITKDPNKTIVMPDNGSVWIGDVNFDLTLWSNKNIAIEINAGYIVSLNEGGVATPIPNKAKEQVKIK